MKVLLVDFDPQAASTRGLDLNPPELERTVYDCIIRGVPAEEVIRDTIIEELDLLPSNLDLAGAEALLMQRIGRKKALDKVLRRVRGRYDLLLIDTPPSLGLLTINALTASTHVIIPVQAQYYPLAGIPLLMEVIKMIEEGLEHRIEVLGFLLTSAVMRYLKLLRSRFSISSTPRELPEEAIKERYPEEFERVREVLL